MGRELSSDLAAEAAWNSNEHTHTHTLEQAGRQIFSVSVCVCFPDAHLFIYYLPILAQGAVNLGSVPLKSFSKWISLFVWNSLNSQ